MALKPTIYKFSIDLADLERDNYQALELTVALHPSETLERMAARVLAFCYNADERLQFGRGLSTADEPDVWQHNLDGSIKLWLEVGEPIAERIKKASHRADQVRVYSFNSKSGTWWQKVGEEYASLPVAVWVFDPAQIRSFAKLIGRTTDCAVTLSATTAWVAIAEQTIEIDCRQLQSSA